ncbi:MAG: ribbon-helix-helix protein, CopG family [Lachnospiraceae bacterium]|nr:ribbon-helix-helix protein, CopG family [Lachnospiraceae bacterium]
MTPRPKANSERTNVFFSPEVMEQLRALAEKKGTSVSGLIRMIVLEFLAQQK